MILTRCHIQLPTHRCAITVSDNSRILVFKYQGNVCDFEIFPGDKSWAASDYIVEPLPTTFYGVTFPGESDYRPY